MENESSLLFNNIYEISRRLTLLRKEASEGFSINYSEGKAIIALSHGRILTQKNLATECDMDGPQVCRVVMRLLIKKIIKKAFKEGNRKTLFISLTDKGSKIADGIINKVDELSHKYFKDLTLEEINEINRISKKILV